jgi:hypothetical protein
VDVSTVDVSRLLLYQLLNGQSNHPSQTVPTGAEYCTCLVRSYIGSQYQHPMSCDWVVGACIESRSDRVRIKTAAAGCVIIRRVCATCLCTAALAAGTGARIVAGPVPRPEPGRSCPAAGR